MRLVTSDEMAALDRAAEAAGVGVLRLMEAAGTAVADAAKRLLRGGRKRRIVVCCGRGNNGGDGLVAARILAKREVPVSVVLAADPKQLDGPPATQFAKLGGKVPVRSVTDVAAATADLFKGAGLIIDALLGTGLRDAPREPIATLIRHINDSGVPVLSVDVPSGLSSDTGQPLGETVRAAVTVTFEALKLGLALQPGAWFAGDIQIVPIGIPDAALASVPSQAALLEDSMVRDWLPKRSPWAHKGDCGRVLVIAGSVGMTGAATLTSMAALRAGAGLVYLAAPQSLNGILEATATEIITLPMLETISRSLSEDAFPALMEQVARCDVVALGPGMSQHPETVSLICRLVREIDRPLVLDADGINAIASDFSALFDRRPPTVLTPHPGEAGRLLGQSAHDVQGNRPAAAWALAAGAHAVTILKGARSLIAEPDGHLWVNPTGGPGLASAGTGDVLTGVVAGLFAQGAAPAQAACAGAYLHGLAGDIATAALGVRSVIASDVLDALPEAFEMVERFDEDARDNADDD